MNKNTDIDIVKCNAETNHLDSSLAEPSISNVTVSNYDEIINHYKNFETRFPIKNVNLKQYSTPVNFKQAKQFPRHRWYTYKEGFSPIFVADFLKRYSTGNDNVVFDPFGGIGTTVLESTLLGYLSFSNDINPLSNYIAKIKTDLYSDEDHDNALKLLSEFIETDLIFEATPPNNDTVKSYFTPEILSSILKVQYWIDSVENVKIRDLFILSLLTILELLSTHKKDGNGVKRKKNPKDGIYLNHIKELIKERIELFILDIDAAKVNQRPKICHQSSFDSYRLEKKADLVITSPPYANCFDYSKVYLVELWFGGFFKNKSDQTRFRESSVISHVHYKWKLRHKEFSHEIVKTKIAKFLNEQELWDKKIPDMLIGYFSDMGKVLSELIPNLNRGAVIGIVVGNSVYAGLPIATDILLSEIAISLGFKLLGIESYRVLTPSSQQLKIIRESDKRFLRESLIILKWE